MIKRDEDKQKLLFNRGTKPCGGGEQLTDLEPSLPRGTWAEGLQPALQRTANGA